MKSLKFLSLWAVPLLLWLWGSGHEYEKTIATNNFAPLDALADPCPLACKDTVNISLDANCEVNLTPYMVYGDTLAACSLQLKVEVFDAQNRPLGTTITDAYKGQVLRYKLTNQVNGDNCWGQIKLQDNIAPELICPEPTNQALVTVFANRLAGELSDEDVAFKRSNFSCWLSNQAQQPGTYFLDTIPFQVAKDGIYTFVLLTDFAEADRGAGAIFEEDFFLEHPCQNVVGFTEGGSLVNNWQSLNDWWIHTPGLGDYLPWLNGNVNRPVLRIELELKKGKTYYLATTSLKPEDTGDFVWLVLRDQITQQPNMGILVDETVHQIPWLTHLVCDDFEKIKLAGEQCYRTDAEGKVISISNDLKNILQLTGYPHEGQDWYERSGAVTDNCGNIEICVTDVLSGSYGSCDDVILKRTFKAKDASGKTNSCTQEITIRKPTSKDIVLPNFTAYIECDQTYPTDSLGNPHPSVTGYPFVKTAFGIRDLTQPFCNISAGYQDKSRIELCDKAFKFIRTWTIVDWCNPGNTFFYNQIIKIGDFTPPVVINAVDSLNCIPTFSTGPFACFAAVTIPAPDTVIDNCSGWTITADVVVVTRTPIYDMEGFIEDYDIEEEVVATGKKPGDIVSNIPKGLHYFKYRVVDDCQNVRIHFLDFEVLDQSEPIAICKDFLNVSIGSTSKINKIFAKDVDGGSFDNCSTIRIEVRRVVAEECIDEYEFLVSEFESGGGNGGGGNPIEEPPILGSDLPIDEPPILGGGEEEEDSVYYTDWADFVYVTCCDIGQTVRIEMRVWDDADGNGIPGEYENIDFCERDIEDNYNICWLDVLVEDKSKPVCKPPVNMTISCLDQRILHTSDFTCEDSTLLNQLFGEFIATDNCEAFIVCDDIIDDRDNCGVGTITRVYHAEDYSGNVSAPCRQTITVTSGHNYEIMFPADVSGQCDVVLDTVIGLNEIGCDVLAVSVQDERFAIPSGECFKILRTFRVINWCEYDGISNPIVISRDEDCDGVLGDEPVYVLRRPGAGGDQPVFIDRNANELDSNPFAGERGLSCTPNPKGYWRKSNSTGYWQYTQLIKVYDNKPPKLFPSPADLFCAAGGCTAQIGIPFVVSEDCTPKDIRFEVVVDLYRDNVDQFTVPQERVQGVYPKFRFEDVFPIGEHLVEIRVGDGCGNVAAFTMPIEVTDCKPPSITCVNGLAVELSPVIPAQDVDGDGAADSGFAEVWASDFVKSISDDCSDSVRYSINRPGETPDINKQRLVFTCNDAGNTVAVEIRAWDNADNPRVIKPDGSVGGPNSAFCVTYVLVQENAPNICSGPGNATIVTGRIATPDGSPLADASVRLANATNAEVVTDANGTYVANVPVFANDVRATPELNRNFTQGVSTYDIYLISQHILGIKPLDSPYKLIAADINNSGSISIIDIILLRKLILSVELGFPGNKSWRFVDKKYKFPAPGNPWQESFPEHLYFRQILEPVAEADFVAVKIGDIDFSALRNSARNKDAAKAFRIQTEDKILTPGQEVTIPFVADLNDLLGYQFTLQFDTDALELSDMEFGIAQVENFGWRFTNEGFITTSWNKTGTAQLSGEARLFSLTFKAKTTGKLSDYLHIGQRYTAAEAYDESGEVQNLELSFGEIADAREFTLLQNIPNPFADATIIPFYLPKAARIKLQVFTSDGRLAYETEGNFDGGYQQIEVSRSQLQGAGVYAYTIEMEGKRLIRRMILL